MKRRARGIPAAAILAGGVSRHGASCSCRICVELRSEQRRARTECEGCDGAVDGGAIAKYRVQHHDGSTSDVHYCDDCAELARMDWNGETAAIEAL